MKNENLANLIINKWFDKFQSGLGSRFSAHRMDYEYHYGFNNSMHSVVVLLAKNNKKTKIELFENGDLIFHYSQNKTANKEEFINCSEDDFHTMLAHAFIYLRDGNFDYHAKWYANLEKRL